MIFWSFVIAGLETPKPGLGSRFGLMTPMSDQILTRKAEESC
jgi:hypothetical protein